MLKGLISLLHCFGIMLLNPYCFRCLLQFFSETLNDTCVFIVQLVDPALAFGSHRLTVYTLILTAEMKLLFEVSYLKFEAAYRCVLLVVFGVEFCIVLCEPPSSLLHRIKISLEFRVALPNLFTVVRRLLFWFSEFSDTCIQLIIPRCQLLDCVECRSVVFTEFLTYFYSIVTFTFVASVFGSQSLVFLETKIEFCTKSLVRRRPLFLL